MSTKSLMVEKFKSLPSFVKFEDRDFNILVDSVSGLYHAPKPDEGNSALSCTCGETFSFRNSTQIPARNLFNSAAVWADCILDARAVGSDSFFFTFFKDYLLMFDAVETLKDLKSWKTASFTESLGFIRALLILGDFHPTEFPFAYYPQDSNWLVVLGPPCSGFRYAASAGPLLIERLLADFRSELLEFVSGKRVETNDLHSGQVILTLNSPTAFADSAFSLKTQKLTIGPSSSSDDEEKFLEGHLKLNLLFALANENALPSNAVKFFYAPRLLVQEFEFFNVATESFALPEKLTGAELREYAKFISMHLTASEIDFLLKREGKASLFKDHVLEPAWVTYKTLTR